MGKTTTLCVRRATYWDADMKVSLSLSLSLHPLRVFCTRLCPHPRTRARALSLLHRVGT